MHIHGVDIKRLLIPGHLQAQGPGSEGDQIGEGRNLQIGLDIEGDRQDRRSHAVARGNHLVRHTQIRLDDLQREIDDEADHPAKFHKIDGGTLIALCYP